MAVYGYVFEPVYAPVVTWWVARRILGGSGVAVVTLDMGLTRSSVRVGDGYAYIGDTVVPLEELERVEKDKAYIVEAGGRLRAVETRACGGYYKLRPVGEEEAPTLEINGIHMHRVSGTTPWRDSLSKVRAARVRRGSRVLDTCMGLGYTAIHSLAAGAAVVHTVEKDPCVVWVARHNPWSRGLASPAIKTFMGDAVEAVAGYPDNYFDRIIHDPPRFTGATGDLYSQRFYRELYRVLRPRGIMYHYTGEPRRRTGNRSPVVRGVGERLRRAGFIARYDPGTMGFIAYKPG